MEKDVARRKLQEASDFFKQKRYNDALTLLCELDTAFPDNKRILYPLASIQAKLGNHGEARRIAQKLRDELGDVRANALLESLPQELAPTMNIPSGVQLEPFPAFTTPADSAKREKKSAQKVETRQKKIQVYVGPAILVTNMAVMITTVGMGSNRELDKPLVFLFYASYIALLIVIVQKWKSLQVKKGKIGWVLFLSVLCHPIGGWGSYIWISRPSGHRSTSSYVPASVKVIARLLLFLLVFVWGCTILAYPITEIGSGRGLSFAAFLAIPAGIIILIASRLMFPRLRR